MKGPCHFLFVQGSLKTFFFLSANQNGKIYSCGANVQIDFKPDFKFEFVHCHVMLRSLQSRS